MEHNEPQLQGWDVGQSSSGRLGVVCGAFAREQFVVFEPQKKSGQAKNFY